MILDEILAHKAYEVAQRKARESEAAVVARAERAEPALDFRAALVGRGVASWTTIGSPTWAIVR